MCKAAVKLHAVCSLYSVLQSVRPSSQFPWQAVMHACVCGPCIPLVEGAKMPPHCIMLSWEVVGFEGARACQ